MPSRRCLLLDTATCCAKTGGSELLEEWRRSADSVLWLDFQETLTEDDVALLTGEFGLDEFTISDIRRQRHPAKMERFENHVFMIVTGLSADTESLDYRTLKISICLGKNFFLTCHDGVSVSTDRLWREVSAEPFPGRPTPATLCYRLCRKIIDRYTPIITAQEERLDNLETAIFTSDGDRSLAELVEINTRLKKLRRVFVYHNDLFAELQGCIEQNNAPELFHRGDLPGFRDVWDHVHRLTTFLDLFQELAVDLINGYTSVSAHNLNNIMKTLTLATVMFLPLSLLVGIYGMNFEFIPELSWRYGYFLLLAAMVCIAGGILILFRRKGWL